ncbi:PilZ domain-containing protein [uncultured Desulfosarcina sp.]|uniref:PilZ domain-containing protein n=1 Tax=uncultured Desulfosarcina sp. TaxID=218289 RepID=UPI0029C9B227|nr:PilZ domain-containing protein [uncultured Desulfosarcina sp.]
MNTVPNNRRYPRHMALFSSKYTVKEGTFRDLIKDIGAGGVFVSTRRKINQGRPINLQFPIFAFKKRFSLMGKVVRCNTTGFAVMFNEPIDEKLFNKDDRGPKCAEDSLVSEDLKN